MKIRELKRGERYRQYGVLFEIIAEKIIIRSDGTPGIAVRYLQPDSTYEPPRWYVGDTGIAGADDEVVNP